LPEGDRIRDAIEHAATRVEEVLAAVKACGTLDDPDRALAGPGFLSGPQEWRP
jgi:hypothetical protein